MPCHSCYIYGTWRIKEVDGFKVIVWREAEERSHEVKGGGTFCEVVNLSGILSELPTSFNLF